MSKLPDTEYCSVEHKDEILLITIDREASLNSLHPPASYELASIFSWFESDSDTRVAIISGSGSKSFCSGNDVKFAATASLSEMRLPKQGFGGLTSAFDRKKPIIAAVNGIAFGGGFEIALACDLIVASDSATFALPEPKIGLAALGGGIHRLARQMPYKKAVELLLTGNKVTASEALELGFVNRVCKQAELIDESLTLARLIARCSPTAIEVTMEALSYSMSNPDLAQNRKHDYELAKKIFTSPDYKEGLKAFSEKRTPSWVS